MPLFAVLVIDFFVVSRGRWDLSGHGPARWLMLVAWAAGFVTYQLINPGYISWWATAWSHVAPLHRLHPGQLDVRLDPVLLRGRAWPPWPCGGLSRLASRGQPRPRSPAAAATAGRGAGPARQAPGRRH